MGNCTPLFHLSLEKDCLIEKLNIALATKKNYCRTAAKCIDRGD